MSIYVSSIEVTGDFRESIIWRVEEMSAVDSWVGSKLERRLSTHRVVLVKESADTPSSLPSSSQFSPHRARAVSSVVNCN